MSRPAGSTPERAESKHLAQAHRLAFISGSADLFTVSRHGGGVVLNLLSEVAADHAAAREDAHFFYPSMSSSAGLPEFAVSTAPGWGCKHMVWRRHCGGTWAHYGEGDAEAARAEPDRLARVPGRTPLDRGGPADRRRPFRPGSARERS